MTTQQPILTVCAWCDLVIATPPTTIIPKVGDLYEKGLQAHLILQGHSISHGICASCRDKELEQWRESQRKAGNNADL